MTAKPVITRLRDLFDVSGTPASGKALIDNGSGTAVWTDVATQAELDAKTLATLADATITTPANGDLLTYSSATSKWRNLSGGSLTAIGDVSIESDTDVSGAGEIIFKVGGVERARIKTDGTGSGLLDTTSLATIHELTAETFYQPNISATGSYGVFVAPFACTIVAASVIAWGGAIAASDTNYWTAELMHYPAGVAIATKTTQATGGQAMAQRTDWNFDSLTFDATQKVCAKGAVIGFRYTPTGAPSALPGVLMSIRYEPS